MDLLASLDPPTTCVDSFFSLGPSMVSSEQLGTLNLSTCSLPPLGGHPPDIYLASEPFSLLLWTLLGLTFAGSSWMLSFWTKWREIEDQDLFDILILATYRHESGAGV
jgi:hypothetical protein